MADVENPKPDADGVHGAAAKAEAGEAIDSLRLCAGAWVAWTILFAVGLLVIFCPSVQAPRAVRVMASVGVSVAIVGFAAGIGWCARVIWPGTNNHGLGR